MSRITKIVCDHCGKTADEHTVNIPDWSGDEWIKVKDNPAVCPSDFCSMACLAGWATTQAALIAARADAASPETSR